MSKQEGRNESSAHTKGDQIGSHKVSGLKSMQSESHLEYLQHEMWSERLTPNVSQNIQLTLWMDLRSVRGSQQGLDAPEPLLRGLHPVRLRATWKTLCLDRCSGPNSPAFRRLNGTEVPLLGSWLTEEWQRWAGEIPILVAAFSVFRVPGTAFCLSVGGPDLVRTLGTRHSIRVTDPFTRHSPRSQLGPGGQTEACPLRLNIYPAQRSPRDTTTGPPHAQSTYTCLFNQNDHP